MSPSRALLRLLSTLALALALAACGGATADDSGVASLTGTSATDTGVDGSATEAELTDEEYEEAILDYVACLRDQGLDVPDPEVDAEGNLRFQLALGPAPGADGAAGDVPDAADREAQLTAFQDAQAECGTPPQPPGGFGFAGGDDTEFQDQALEMAQCLRDQGLDVADPDFSGAGGPGQGGGPGGFGGGLDLEDPDTQAALEACQSDIFGTGGPGGFVAGPGGPGGRGGAGAAEGQ